MTRTMPRTMTRTRRHGPLAVYESGNQAGPVLLLLHGLTDSGECWGDLVARLGATYRILAPDALGHGRSDRFTPEQLTAGDPMEPMYDATSSLLETVGDETLVLGHSMGGGVAAALAARRPELVRAAVLEDPAWLDGPASGEPEQDTRERVEDARATAADPGAAIARCLREHPTWPEVELEPWARAKADADEAFLRTGRAMLEEPWPEIARAIARPTLVVTGDRGVILDAAALAEVARLGNEALEVAVVPGAAHCVRRDRGDTFHAVVDPWLARHAGRPGAPLG